MNSKPVWLEAALEGAALICRDGSTAYVRYIEEKLHLSPQLVGVVIPAKGKPRLQTWPLGGMFITTSDDEPLLYGFDIMGLAPPVFEYWHVLNKDIRFLAKDEDNMWCGFKEEPIIQDYDWRPHGDGNIDIRILGLDPSIFPECPWQHSLIERPDDD